jgi:hypothetical protein
LPKLRKWAKKWTLLLYRLSSMWNGRFHLPKYRGKVQKMGVLYIHSPKMPSPSANFIIKLKKNFV